MLVESFHVKLSCSLWGHARAGTAVFALALTQNSRL